MSFVRKFVWAMYCLFKKGTDPKLRQSVQNSIDRKHLDFLLLDSKTFKPVYAIELDDMSVIVFP